MTDHHSLPHSKGGTRHPDNIYRLKANVHSAFHVVFENHSPVEQFRDLLHFNISLWNEIRQRVYDILEDYKWKDEIYAYRKWVLIPSKFLDTI